MRYPIVLTCALAIATSTVGVSAGRDARATEVLAAARKTIGDKKLSALKTLSLEAQVQRNVGAMQMSTDTEILLELPGRYLRSDTGSGPISGGFTSGFNGDKVIRPAGANMSIAGGGMVVRFGGPGGPMPPAPGEKPSPEDLERMDKMMLRTARVELSRLMLGWFASAHPSLGAEFTYAGEAESPDGKADAIDVKDADGFNARLFIDRETRLPLMVTYQGPQPRMITTGGPPRRAAGAPGGAQAGGETSARRVMSEEERKKAADEAEKQMEAIRSQPPTMVEFTLFFEDWRDVGGIKFPHKLRRASAGATNEEWTVSKVKVNPKIDPNKFDG